MALHKKCLKCQEYELVSYLIDGLCVFCAADKIKVLQAELDQHRWIPVGDLPEMFLKPHPAHETEWKTYFEVLENGATLPKFMRAENIWCNEGLEVEWYRPITLPKEADK